MQYKFSFIYKLREGRYLFLNVYCNLKFISDNIKPYNNDKNSRSPAEKCNSKNDYLENIITKGWIDSITFRNFKCSRLYNEEEHHIFGSLSARVSLTDRRTIYEFNSKLGRHI